MSLTDREDDLAREHLGRAHYAILPFSESTVSGLSEYEEQKLRDRQRTKAEEYSDKTP